MTRSKAMEKRPNSPAWYWMQVVMGVMTMSLFVFERHQPHAASWTVTLGLSAAVPLCVLAGLRLFAPVTAESFACFLRTHGDRALAILSPACLLVSIGLLMVVLMTSPHLGGLPNVGWTFLFLQRAVDDLRGRAIDGGRPQPYEILHVTPQTPRL